LLEPARPSNRLSRTTTSSDGGQPLQESYVHDIHGNMTRMPHLPIMRWDFDDHLRASSRQVVRNGGTPELTYYTYDASGERIRKVTERQAVPGVTPTRRRERVCLDGFEIYREFEIDGVTVSLERETLHVLDDEERVALVETRTIGDDDAPAELIRHQCGNHLGSACLELDAVGAIISYEEFYPYGSTAYQAGRTVAEVSTKRYRYVARERDEESGLGYHGARYYASWLGRWTAADPMGVSGGLNLYAYANGSPMKFTDVTGQAPNEPTKPSRLKEQGKMVVQAIGVVVGLLTGKKAIGVRPEHIPAPKASEDAPKPTQAGKGPPLPPPDPTTPNPEPRHDIRQTHANDRILTPEERPTHRIRDVAEQARTKYGKPARFTRAVGGLASHAVGALGTGVAIFAGIAVYVQTGDARAALKTTAEHAFPGGPPEERLAMTYEQIEVPIAGFYSAPELLRPDAATPKTSPTLPADLSTPGLIGRRPTPSRIDKQLIERIVNEEKRRQRELLRFLQSFRWPTLR
jgi:RHS repeat-associated protein